MAYSGRALARIGGFGTNSGHDLAQHCHSFGVGVVAFMVDLAVEYGFCRRAHARDHE